MDNSSQREGGGALKPVILRVGVAIILSVTGLIFARFMSRKVDEDDEDEVTSSTSNLESERLGHHQKQEILSLKTKFEELQKKEIEIELRFERYCNLKDQEIVLMEQKSKLSFEKSQLDFFFREVLVMEEGYNRVYDLVIVYFKLVGEIEKLRSENRLLVGKVKRFRRRIKQFLRSFDELESKISMVKKLEGEVKDLKNAIDVLKKEKEEVFRNSSDSKSELVNAEDYRKLLEEYEDLKKDFANEVRETINLRWSNACLRHEVMRNQTKYGEIMFSPNENLQEMGMDDQANAMAMTVTDHDHHEESHHNHNHEDKHHDHHHKEKHHDHPHEENPHDHHHAEKHHDHHHEEKKHHDHPHEENHHDHEEKHHNHDYEENQHESSRRKRLMKKLKRWVEGNEKGKSRKPEERCFGRHSLSVESEEEEEHMFQSRRSCSSV